MPGLGRAPALLRPLRLVEAELVRVRGQPPVPGRPERELLVLVLEVDRAAPAVPAGAGHGGVSAEPLRAVVVTPPLLHLVRAVARLDARRHRFARREERTRLGLDEHALTLGGGHPVSYTHLRAHETDSYL